MQDACQLATGDVSDMISMYLQLHTAAAINSGRVTGSFLPEKAICMDIADYPFVQPEEVC